MFQEFMARTEMVIEPHSLPRSLDYAARRAQLRRGRKNRAASLGMTEKANSPSGVKPHGSPSVIPSGMADFFLRAARTSAMQRGTVARLQLQRGFTCRRGNLWTGMSEALRFGATSTHSPLPQKSPYADQCRQASFPGTSAPCCGTA